MNTDFFKRKQSKTPPDGRIMMPDLNDSSLDQPDQNQPTLNQDALGTAIPDDHSSHHINDLIDGPLKSAVAMRLQNLLAEYPQPDQYKPSTTRKVVGGIAGAMTGLTQGAEAGGKLNREILDNPYQKALGDWNAKYKPLEQSYGLESTANKNMFSNLKDYADFMHSQNQDDPTLQRRLASAKTGGEEAAKEDFRVKGDERKVAGELKVEGVRQTGENSRNANTVYGSRANNQDSIRSSNSQNTENILSRERIAEADRLSREGIARRRGEIQKELQKAQFHETRVPVDQQVKARMDAESEVLAGNLPIGVNPINKDELDAISDLVTPRNSNGQVTGPAYRVFKSESEVPPNYKGNLKILKAHAAKKANDMLNEGFSNREQTGGKIDSEWIEVP